MIHGIHHISLKCGTPEELASVKAFYCGLLELKPAREWPEGMMIDTGSGLIEVFTTGDGVRAKGAIRHLALAVDDMDAVLEETQAMGLPMLYGGPSGVEEPTWSSRFFTVKMPGGEKVEFNMRTPFPEEN